MCACARLHVVLLTRLQKLRACIIGTRLDMCGENMAEKWFVTDIESVLIDGEFLPELAKLKNLEEEVKEITLKGIRGEISWEEGLRQRINLLKGASYEDALNVADSLPLMRNAKETCGKIQKLGYKIAAISGGFDLLADRVEKELGLDYVFANKLIFRYGRLVDIELKVTSDKAGVLKKLLEKNGEVYTRPNLRIAFNAQPVVKEYADVVVDEKDLLKVIPYFQNSENSSENCSSHVVAVIDGTNDLTLFGIYKYVS